MPQDQESGARAVKYGLQTARKIAQELGGAKIGNARSNEYEVSGRKIVIKCARLNTKSVGVPYRLLDSVAAIFGSFHSLINLALPAVSPAVTRLTPSLARLCSH